MEYLLRTVLVDDDPFNIVDLKDILSPYLHQIEIVSEFNSAFKACDYINEYNPDIVFLDIEMPGLGGFEMLQKLKVATPIIIFVTAHAEFALESFEHSPADFLLKPLDPIKLDRAINNAIKDFNAKQNEDRLTAQQRISGHLPIKYKDRYGITRNPFILPDDILLIKTDESDSHYVEVHTIDGDVYGPVKNSLTGFHKLIDKTQFIHVYKNMIANRAQFLELIDNKYLILNGREKIKVEVSRRFCKMIKKSLTEN